jgi:hypothetical protein
MGKGDVDLVELRGEVMAELVESEYQENADGEGESIMKI